MPPNVFTIPPGAPFLATFARALVAGDIIAGLSGRDPLGLARATIYVPTRRAARALAQELATALDRPAVLLPRIRPLGGLDEAGVMFGGGDPLALPAPIGAIERQMLLARLVQQWSRALAHAIVRVGADGRPQTDPGEPLMVATHFAGAWQLAGELAGLIDELIIEGVAWKKLEGLGGAFDDYWRITLNFLDIAMSQWPLILAARGLIDPASHQVRLVESQIATLQAGQQAGFCHAPVIAIGSTGTNSATARLLAAIARHPHGAVVLPGLDQMLDEASFARIAIGPGNSADENSDASPDASPDPSPDPAPDPAPDASLDPAPDPSAGHPQAALRRLLGFLGIARPDVRALGRPPPDLAARARFLSQALRPADTTDLWGAYLAEAGGEIAPALAGVTMIEAADEREEALALAIAMRGVLEEPGATAALVTPNRDIATRVRAELLRWGVDVDDSGGEPLGNTPLGTLARLVLQYGFGGHAALDLAALLAHPLVRLALPRAELVRRAAMLETGVLRVALPTLPGGAIDALVAAARTHAANRHAHPALHRMNDADWHAIADLLRAIHAAFAPLGSLGTHAPLQHWLSAHRAVILALIEVPEPEDPVSGAPMEALAGLLDALDAAAPGDLHLGCAEYLGFFETLVRSEIFRGPRRAHPRLKILGLLEARLIRADVMLLAGFDETVWPPQAQSDAFLNRTMRAALGLSAPERRIGQTAHDFTEAMGEARVFLSRSSKRGGSPMVPSRLVQRMAALGGTHWQACRARGNVWLDLARGLDVPERSLTLVQPTPRPPVSLRPTRLSVTQIETLRRDPYSIFASEILRLKPLDPIGAPLGAADTGEHVHAVLAQFSDAFPAGPLPGDAAGTLHAMAQAALAEQLKNADFRAFQWPRVRKALEYYVGWETGRRAGIARVISERGGSVQLPLADGSVFTLTARADRTEMAADGSVVLVDFKTGNVPSKKEVAAGFAPQLTLEAMMVQRGAFGLKPGTQVRGALYLKLMGGDEGGKEQSVGGREGLFADLVAGHSRELLVLLDQFRLIDTPYLPRPFVQFLAKFNAYDHLARVVEWAGQGAEGEA